MKKIISSVIAIFLSIILFTNVSAVEVSTDTISAGSYLIGTHLFDRDGSSSYDGTLTVRHIMLASKTIPGNTIADMQILYNRARDGVWLDAITNEEVDMPEKVNVEYRNLEQMLVAPTLFKASGGIGYANVSIVSTGAYASQEMWETISGYELYEKAGEELTLIGKYETEKSVKLTVKAGERKVYVARVLSYNDKSQAIYSDYSNEIILELPLVAPTLATGLGGFGVTDLSIIEVGAYGYEDMWNAIDGYELYEKNGEELTLIDEYEPREVAEVAAAPHESRVIVARVFVYYNENQKVYSDYSNEYVVKNTLPVPTLAPAIPNVVIGIVQDGPYGYEDMWNSIGGYELYEKAGEELTLVDEYEPTEGATVRVGLGETKTYVARVFVYNSANEKVYSDYSNEYTITNTAIAAYGDIDNNVILDENDAYLLEDYLMGEDVDISEQGMKNADLNGDGVVNDDDYPILIELLVGGTTVPLWNTLENVTKIEYYILDELGANEYLISVPEGVEIEWNGEYQFAENSVIYDKALFRLPPDFDELPRFEGWYLDEEGTNKFDITKPLTGTIKLYAIFDMELIVKYDGNGATSGEMLDSVHIIGETSNLSKNTYVRTGYKFAGWIGETEDYDIVASDEDDFEVPLWFLWETKSPLTLYAVWEKEVVLGDVTGDGQVDVGDAAAVLGYTSGRTDLTEAQKIAADVNLDGDIDEIDAIILLKKDANLIEGLPYDSGEKYAITYNLDGGTDDEISSLSKLYATKLLPIQLGQPVKEGYVFIGWTGSNGDIPETEVTITEGTTGNLTYTANWILLGDVTGDSLVDNGDAIKVWRYAAGLEILTEEELIAADVNLDGDIDEIDRVIIQKYDASYITSLPYDSGEKYTITYNLNGGIAEQPLDRVYAEISLPTKVGYVTKKGYVFIGWTGSNGDTPQKEVTIPSGTTGNLEYTANWLKLGDINEDGILNEDDSNLLLQYTMFPDLYQISEVVKLNSDFNQDGVLDMNDAIILEDYINGKIDSLTV